MGIVHEYALLESEQEVPNLFSPKCFGLLINNAAVGWVDGMIIQSIYPFFNVYLNMDGYQLTAANIIINLPFSLKLLFAVFSDSFPIMNQRRKPYMNIGWFLCGVALFIASWLHTPDRYYFIHSQEIANPKASYQGISYIGALFMAKLGLVLTIVADDGIMVEYAQREPESIRGTLQSSVYFVRMLSGTVAFMFVGVLLNGEKYGGTFGFELPINLVYAIAGTICFGTIPFTTFMLEDRRVHKESFTLRMQEMWIIVHNRAIWQICFYFLLSGLFTSFSAIPSSIVQREWAKVTPLANTLAAVLGGCIFSFSILLTKKYLLNVSWRKIMFVGSLSCVVLDMICSSLTIYNIYRSQWFWISMPLLERIPGGMQFIVGSFVTAEVATKGYESATYSLITTVNTVAAPLGATLAKIIDSYLDAFKSDVEKDTPYVRNQVMFTFGIMYVFHLLSNVWLCILPRQKKEAQELKLRKDTNQCAGIILLLICSFALIWAVLSSILTINPSTSCFKISGGKGC